MTAYGAAQAARTVFQLARPSRRAFFMEVVMADHIDIDFIFQADRENPPAERSLPWEETRDGVTVVVEPKPHWAEDLRAFRLNAREYCYYADWSRYGARARFYGHIDTCGDDLLLKARALIVREIAEGHWS
jgi:hypothetical protein